MIESVADAVGLEAIIERHPEQPGDVRRTYADVSKAERLFGYRPSVPFEEGVRRFGEWFVREHDLHAPAVTVA
jgi:UDP-glucuronate 4-epimerase